jgi:hypothetical protein
MLGISRTTATIDSRSNKGESPSQPARRAQGLGLQTYAAKKVLETWISTQGIKQQVRF